MKKSLLFLLALITSITLYASDVILSNTLGAYYCAQEPNPKTYIKHTVEEPISIYWENNVYPGFNDEECKGMVANYLDGVRLQRMALNTPDGKVKVYRYKELSQNYIDLLNESETVKKEMLVKEKVFNQARGYKKEYRKYPSDFNQTRALGAAGAIQVIKLNPYQTLLSGYDNGDGIINNGDTVSDYLYIQTNSDVWFQSTIQNKAVA